MKPSTPPTVPKEHLHEHVQKLTDDMLAIGKKGLSTENLPFKLFRGIFTSGIPLEVDAFGASVIFSDGVITKTSYNSLKNGLLQVTLVFEDGGEHSTALILVQEKLPSER